LAALPCWRDSVEPLVPFFGGPRESLVRRARRQILRPLIERSITQRRVDATGRHTATGPAVLIEHDGIVTLVAERLGAGQACHSHTDNSDPHDILRVGVPRLSLRPTEGPQTPGSSIGAGLGADFSLRLPAPDDASTSNVSAAEDDLVPHGRGEQAVEKRYVVTAHRIERRTVLRWQVEAERGDIVGHLLRPAHAH
jgi:hypothetical protein